MAKETKGAAASIGKKLPFRAKLGYGTIGLGQMPNTMITLWQAFFLTTFAGLDIAAAGAIVSIGQIVAAFVAPVWGYISDRMYSTAIGRKLGRRKGTLLLSVPVQFICCLMQFFPGMPVWGYAVTNFLYWAANGGYSTVQYVLPSEMSDNSDDRAQLVGINQIAGAVGTIAFNSLNAYLFTVWGQDSWTSFFYMAIIYNVAMLAVLLFGMFTIQERPYDETTDFSKSDTHDGDKAPGIQRIALLLWNYVSTFSIREFRNYLGMYLSEIMFRAVRGSILSFFLIYSLSLSASEVSLSQGVSFVIGILLVGFFIWLNSKIGARKAYRVGAIEAIVVFLLMFVLAQVHGTIGHAATVTGWIALSLCLNFGITGCVNATDFAYSFIPDVDEILTGKRREGQYASVNSTIDNIFMAIENIVITGALSAVGFVSGAETQPVEVVEALTGIFVFVPIFFCLLGIFFSTRMQLNDEKRAVLGAEIARLRAGGSKADVEPETKALVESITGFPYEKCWGNNRVINYAYKPTNDAADAATATAAGDTAASSTPTGDAVASATPSSSSASA